MKKNRKRYPCILQHDETDCAAAALATICAYYRKEIPIVELREKIGTDKYGTTVDGIVKGAENLGFQTQGIKMAEENLTDDFTLPAIAQIKTMNGDSHFVVLYKKSKNKLLIADPSKGLFTQTKAEFLQNFLGVLILLAPTSEFEQINYEKTTLLGVFFSLIYPQKKLLGTVILTSFFLTILGIVASFFSRVLFDEIIPYELRTSLFVYAVVFGMISLTQIFLSAFRQQMLLFLSRKVDIPVLLGYYRHVLKLPYAFFTVRKAGDIFTRFQDAMTIKDIFSQVSVSLVLDVVLATITSLVLWNMNQRLFGVLLVMVVINILLVYLFKKPYKKLNYEQMEAASDMNSHLIESIKNIETVKSYHNEEMKMLQLERRFVKVLKLEYKEGVLGNIQEIISSGSGIIGNLVFLSIGALAIMDNQMTIGDLIVFQTLSGYFIEPVQNLVSLQLTFQEAQIAMKRLSELMSIEPEHTNEKELLKDLDLSGRLHFENVSFRYGSRPPVLKSFDLEIPKGAKLGIVGESGAGKSTLAKLLMKFYVPVQGSVTLNEYDLADIDTYYLREQIGYVPQRIELFSGTIFDNIKVGNPKATYEQVVSASLKAGSHAFIQKLPNRYYSMVEEEGGNLSGGEKQRIAIARALLRKRQLYVFDESTSNLDSFSEKSIREMMIEKTKGITTIIIAHRLSTILQCDKIIFMEKGAIIEQGTHEELMEKNGKYKKMIDLQYSIIGHSSQTSENQTEEFAEEISY